MSPHYFHVNGLPTRKSDTYGWADLVEILCLLNLDGEVSLPEVIDRVLELELPQSRPDRDASKVFTRRKVQSEDWFRHMQYREQVFGEAYPYSVSSDGELAELKQDLKPCQHLYLFLLLASNLKYIDIHSGVRNTLTNDFELVSQVALTNSLPGWEIYLFDSGKHTTGRYAGNTWSKLKTLADDLNHAVNAIQGDFEPTDTADLGLDIVCWMPTKDDTPGLPMVFAQCACTEKWVDKQSTVLFDHWTPLLQFLPAELISLTMTPIFYRSTHGGWHKTRILKTVLADRLRIMRWLGEDCSVLYSLKSYSVVEEALAYSEPLF